jgi:hypothetical protein
MPDGWEIQYGLNPSSASDAGLDLDGDGLTNLQEYQWGANPTNPDTDGDGAMDGDEKDGNTNPKDPGSAPQEGWIVLTGDHAKGERKALKRTVTIPKGQTRLVMVVLHSEEYPEYTEYDSEFDDVLEWKITPTAGTAIAGQTNVNDKHVDWQLADAEGTTIKNFYPVHIEKVSSLTAPPEKDLTVTLELAATNISDDEKPSTVMVGLLPVDIKVKQPIVGSANFTDEADTNTPQGTIQNDLIKFPVTSTVPTGYAGVVKIDSSWTVTSEERGIVTGGLVAFFKVDTAGSINIARWKEHCTLPALFDEQFAAYERLVGPVPEEYYITRNGSGSWVKNLVPKELKLALSELRKHPGTTGSIKVKATLYILKQADYAQLNWNKLPITGATETLTNNITPNRFRNPPRQTTDYFTDPSGVSGAITSVSDEQTFEW